MLELTTRKCLSEQTRKLRKKINSPTYRKQFVKRKRWESYLIFKIFFMRSTISLEAKGFKM